MFCANLKLNTWPHAVVMAVLLPTIHARGACAKQRFSGKTEAGDL
jgi:hypothetical protein